MRTAGTYPRSRLGIFLRLCIVFIVSMLAIIATGVDDFSAFPQLLRH